MKPFVLTWEWEAAGRVRAPELAATWARLVIQVRGIAVTRLVDTSAQSLRDGVYVPLYPLAEWLACNWWALFHQYSSRQQAGSFPRSHNLRYAGDGFALPDLALESAGETMLLRWRLRPMPGCQVQFIEQGEYRLDTRSIEEELRCFIEAVIRRLRDSGVEKSFLEEEWSAVCESMASAEEREFCEAMAALGLDPYDCADDMAQGVLDLAQRVPRSLCGEFLSATSAARLHSDAEWLLGLLGQTQPESELARAWLSLSKELPRLSMDDPWSQGYGLAREIRRKLCLEQKVPLTSDDLLAPAAPAGLAWLFSGDFPPSIHALLHFSPRDGPLLHLRKAKREDSQRFWICRALCEVLLARGGEPSLVSEAESPRQKRNRAFAAELLAPAAVLRQRLSSSWVDRETVEDLAAEFQVSSYIIQHQIVNHKLADILDSDEAPAAGSGP